MSRSFLVALVMLGVAAGAAAQSPRSAATRTASRTPALDPDAITRGVGHALGEIAAAAYGAAA